jgi:hypothetical protein
LSRWIERVGVAHEAQLDTWFIRLSHLRKLSDA